MLPEVCEGQDITMLTENQNSPRVYDGIIKVCYWKYDDSELALGGISFMPSFVKIRRVFQNLCLRES
jgi:hypothetical protein